MLKKASTPFLAFLQATGLVIYITLVSVFFNFITPNVNRLDAQFFAPIVMLLLFIISAVISASLVLGRAAVLFWDKQYKKSFTLIAWTIGWGIFYFILFILFLYRV
ncbi:MAG: hypothetical protein JW922_09475 [Paludibacteraceae bacterium]|nr:hypothetical protein [Paludibacteraceae bacterium]